jgi:hypothetical protein
MDIGKLTIRRPDAPQPYWAVVHIIYDDGPVVAVLWWDDEPSSGFSMDAEGVVDEEPAELLGGWCSWIVGDEGASAEDPRSSAANVRVDGPGGDPQEALGGMALSLEQSAEPTLSYEESLERIERMLWASTPTDRMES